MMIKYIGAAILMGFASMRVSAMSGEELLQQCTAPEKSVEHKLCGSYILGVMSGANMMMIGTKQLHQNPLYPVLFCVTPAVPTTQLIDVVVRYLTANPDGRKYDAGSEVLLAFQGAYPCTNS
jgi:hypothetical protein